MPLIDGKFEPLDALPKHLNLLINKDEDWRYRCMWGGRCGAKDWEVAAFFVELGIRQPVKILFTREVQATIEESVYELLCNTITRLGYDEYYRVLKNKIVGVQYNTKFIFKGIKDVNKKDVKSYEDVDYAVVCEAEDFSEDSFDMLDPTIRKPKSQIIFIFNPNQEDDFTYQFCVAKPRPNMLSQHVTYKDNPHTSKEVLAQIAYDKANDYQKYLWKWMGQPKNTGGKVYPMFNEKVHVRDVDINRIEPVANFFMGQDPHTVYYPFCIWMGREPRGDGTYNYFIYNEYPTINSKDFNGKLYHELRKEKKCALTLRQRATLYKILDNTTTDTYPHIKIKARGIDTRFAKGAGTSSTTSNTRGIIVEMADPSHGGLTFQTPPEYTIDSQRENIRELLSYDVDQPMSAFNEPRLYISSHCRNVIDSLKFHRFDRDGKEREDEKRKDPSDALKICMATAQMYKHQIKTEQKQYRPVEDTVGNLKSQYLGAGSTVSMG